jgi:hypothetical protein
MRQGGRQARHCSVSQSIRKPPTVEEGGDLIYVDQEVSEVSRQSVSHSLV